METIIQEIEDRAVRGKKVKALRRAGITPANIYGHGIESRAVQANTDALEKTLAKAGYTQLITLKNPADKDRRVLLKDLQRDILSSQLLHVDFHQVKLTDKVKVSIPIIFEGEAKASRRNDLNVLEYLNSIDVECLPTEIPENITVNISELAEAGDRLLVSDLTLDDRISVSTHQDDILIAVSQAKMEAEVEEIEEVEAEEAVEEEAVAETEAEAEKPAEAEAEEQSEE
ncbi:MAG: 50S ribosomal protein L25 [Dehalococcoidia bacterium]